jgi:predicted ArsR family transcriptional regulator
MVGETAGRNILKILRKSENGLTIDQLCEELRVTPMAVHRPLTLLVDQGLVKSQQIHSGTKGRPAHVYKITEAADELFPKTYGNLALQLLQQLRSDEGMSRVRKLFDVIFRNSARKIRERMKGKTFSERVRTMSQILNENEYMSDQKQINNEKFVIKMLNCPISKVAREFPQVCSCEQRFLTKLLQAKVKRDHHILNGQSYCSYIIQK